MLSEYEYRPRKKLKRLDIVDKEDDHDMEVQIEEKP